MIKKTNKRIIFNKLKVN